MTKRILLPSAICILAIALFVILLSPKKNDDSNSSGSSAENTPTKASTNNHNPEEADTKTKRQREDSEGAMARREMEQEFDKLLPARFPDQPSSLCDATLEPGETLVLGGFRKADGDYEFTMLEVEPLGADGTPLKTGDAAPYYRVTTRTFGMSRGKSLEMGLGSLISSAKTRIQKSIAFPPGDTPWYDGDARVMTMPSATTKPGAAATMSIVRDDQGYVISVIVSPTDTGQSLRIRTRIESPAEDLSWR